MRRVGIMSTERLKAELPMHEDNGISGFEKIFCGCGSSSTCVEHSAL